MPAHEVLVTDGGFRPDGTFVTWPVHDTARLTEAFRRAVLRLFARRALFDEDQVQSMLQWPHSGYVHDGVWVSEDDRDFSRRLERYCARNPVALERLTYDAGPTGVNQVTYRSDKRTARRRETRRLISWSSWSACSRTSCPRAIDTRRIASAIASFAMR